MSSSIPTTHCEYRRTGIDGVESGLELKKDVPVPKPGRCQVLVRVHAASLNFHDIPVLTTKQVAQMSVHGIPLSDGAGEVVALGEGVTEWKVGARVASTFTPSLLGGSQRWWNPLTMSLGADLDGVLAQYIAADESGLVDIGDLSYEEAATLPCSGVTAWNALYAGVSPLKAGRIVLVQGTGGVSILGAQIALAAGARVIATSSSDQKLARLAKLGVAKDDLINYKTTPEWSKRVLELTNSCGVDHILEVGGPGSVAQSVASIRVGGEVSIIGFVGGAEGSFNPLQILARGASMRGILVGNREMFRELLESVQYNKIRPVVDRVFPFEQAIEAFKYLESGVHFGKVVIKIV